MLECAGWRVELETKVYEVFMIVGGLGGFESLRIYANQLNFMSSYHGLATLKLFEGPSPAVYTVQGGAGTWRQLLHYNLLKICCQLFLLSPPDAVRA